MVEKKMQINISYYSMTQTKSVEKKMRNN